MSLKLNSRAFSDGESIPIKFTCDGDDISPPLDWSEIPTSTKSLAIICDDPDAPSGVFVHWVLYDLGPTVTCSADGGSCSGGC
jgi:Raf kinase inhibitor-like YbhB/YbcL family protein